MYAGIMFSRPRALPAGFIPPCLPTKAPRPPAGELWLHEKPARRGESITYFERFSSHANISITCFSWALMIASASLRFSGSLPYLSSTRAMEIAP